MLGEVAVNLIPPKRTALHGAAAFGFAALAVAGYAIERIGDDAIVNSLETRATNAEQQLKKYTPRDLSSSAQQSVADAVRPFKGQWFNGAVNPGVDDGCTFWKTLRDALQKGEWVLTSLASNMMKSCDGDAAVPVSTNPGVAIKLHAARQDALSPAANALAKALLKLHIKATIETTDSDQNDAENSIIWVTIGVRAPTE